MRIQLAIFMDMPQNLQEAWLNQFSAFGKMMVLGQALELGRKIKAIGNDEEIGVNMKTIKMAEILQQEIGIAA